jgi:hypothetical protein
LKRKAGLRLDTGLAIRRGGDSGPAIESGSSAESLLIERVTDSDLKLRMPPEGPPLTSDQVATLRAWIDQGATSPPDELPERDPNQHWAFVPPVRPSVPVRATDGWARTRVDAFLAQAYDKRGLVPLPPAQLHVLLRRVYLDLIGLPPTREELHAFLADPSPAAYERVVDRLLASPQYGERWARHWMDVWRYSDWYGRRAVPDVLNSYAQIWRWRDWIVRALNEDRGYDQMVQAMLAADELTPNDPNELAATGYLVRNWYRWNYNLWMKDNVEHVGKAFLGLTFNCAHCHDHKYDPITQEDYFAFRAFFEPLELRHDRVAGEPDPGPYPKYEYGKAYAPITSGMVRVFDEKLDAKTFLYTRGESRNIAPGRAPIGPRMPYFLGGESLSIEPIALPQEVAHPALKAFIQQEEITSRAVALNRAEQSLAQTQALDDAAQRALSRVEARVAPGHPRAFAEYVQGPLAFPVSPPSRDLPRARSAADAARWNRLIDEARAASCASECAALQARIAADRARFTNSCADTTTLRGAAARAERRAAVARCELELAHAERGLAAARTKAEGDDKAKAEVASTEESRTTARAALDAARTSATVDSTDYTPLAPSYPERSTGRRSALARWITARANPLTARVAVNHIWRWHFGTPLVATTFDFGRNGAVPTHPELLDWLAVELAEPGNAAAQSWSMKRLHRVIITSAAYRMSSHASDPQHPNRAVDPDNRAYWRFPPARLEAEEVRDSLLHAAGRLEQVLGGPDIDFTQGLTRSRRSLYFTHHGEAAMPFLELFDAPDVCEAYRRSTSVAPQQALALVNNDMVLDLSRKLAERLWREAGLREGGNGCSDAFVAAAFEQVLGRLPRAEERTLMLDFLERQAEIVAKEAEPGRIDDGGAIARRDLIHALFSHNDFIMVH